MNWMKSLFFFTTLLLVSCQEHVSETELSNLNGYWEIEKVVLSDGTEKDYKVNMSIDYFEWKGHEGFRQKVMPQVDGGYLTNEVQEQIQVVFEGKKAWIHYHTEFADWKELLMVVKPNRLVVKNEQDITYHYKRPIAFSEK